MYGEIVFYTHGSTIEYGGEIFPAGELTADNIELCSRGLSPHPASFGSHEGLGQTV